MKRFILCLVVVLVCLGLFTTPSIAGEKIKDKRVAAVVLWYTVDGKPHNVFIVDYNHLTILDEAIIIDRTPEFAPPDQVLKGGLFDFQYFGYDQVFDYSSGRLKEKYPKFAMQFKAKANEHLMLEKPKREGLQ